MVAPKSPTVPRSPIAHSITFDLSGKSLTEIPTVENPEKYSVVDLSHNMLSNLHGLEQFICAHTVNLDDNAIIGEKGCFPELPSVTYLSLNQNKIRDMAIFITALAQGFPSLAHLSVLKNPGIPNIFTASAVTDQYQQFRYRLISEVPTLKHIDFSAVTQSETTDAMQVRHIRMSTRRSVLASQKNRIKVEEIPDSPMKTPKVTTTVGKCRYIYYGRQSEGNRYIKEDDL
ncbi:hypothetical protein J8273_4715 [Carpediemonas membranifera]|uniref:Leucine rich repeat (LRR) protein n=1 Tax=Carpediemonas membranifera TaxID=201153 RepID=A0A8J6BBE7_9EUKA|nr:hypothetical protein J8273_4715 [Carpediemonas membranifera]|eukprot:KAG9393852.1 hypothetical protein J8273_4715 [Carpediemonas membranifera]